MIQKERENLLVLLREYHETTIPEASSTETGVFVSDLERMKDKIVSMVLGMVRGDEIFKDWSVELRDFETRIKSQEKLSDAQIKERDLLNEKISQLLAVNKLAQKVM